MYSFFAEFPKGLPLEIRYRLMREKWDEEVLYTGEGMNYFNFCDFEPSRCPYPEGYCECGEYVDDDIE